MAEVSLDVGQVIDAAWAAQAQALPPPAQDGLLAKADAIREEPAGMAPALGCYRALSERLDVSQPDDAERAIWLFEHMAHPDPGTAPLASAALEVGEPGTELWFQGAFRSAQIERDVGRVEEATQRLFVLLGDVAGRGDRWEGLVAANLALCLQQQDREVETLVLCRRALAHFERLGDRRRIVRIRQLVMNVFVSFRDWRRYELERERLEREMETLPDADRPQVDMADLLIRAQAAFERTAYDTALTHLAELASRYPHRSTWAVATRAYVLAVMGEAMEARMLLDEAHADTVFGPQYALLNDTTRALCAIVLDPVALATELATTYLARIAVAGDPPGNRVTMLLHVARELGRRVALAPMAKHAYDLAAAAIVERIVEVDRFARERPTLIELSAAERGTLGELRIRLLAQQQELMRAVADLLKAARKRGESLPSEWYGREGLLCVCAWCGCMKRGDDGWVPVGTFIPDDRTLQLTHDICPDCYEERAGEERAARRP